LSRSSRSTSKVRRLNHGELIYKDSIEATMQRFPVEASLEDIYVRVGDLAP